MRGKMKIVWEKRTRQRRKVNIKLNERRSDGKGILIPCNEFKCPASCGSHPSHRRALKIWCSEVEHRHDANPCSGLSEGVNVSESERICSWSKHLWNIYEWMTMRFFNIKDCLAEMNGSKRRLATCDEEKKQNGELKFNRITWDQNMHQEKKNVLW